MVVDQAQGVHAPRTDDTGSHRNPAAVVVDRFRLSLVNASAPPLGRSCLSALVLSVRRADFCGSATVSERASSSPAMKALISRWALLPPDMLTLFSAVLNQSIMTGRATHSDPVALPTPIPNYRFCQPDGQGIRVVFRIGGVREPIRTCSGSDRHGTAPDCPQLPDAGRCRRTSPLNPGSKVVL